MDFNLTDLMRKERIAKVENFVVEGRFSVVLLTGEIGVGDTVGAALADAKQHKLADAA